MPTNALIYARVSQDRNDGRSVAEQERECREESKRRGWAVVDVLVDNSIGASRHSTGDREGWRQVQARIGAGGVDVLVVWEASRAGRDLGAFVELRDLLDKTGTKLCYSGRLLDLDDPADRFGAGLDSLISERAAEDTSKRIRRAMRGNAEHGRPHGRLLYGYQRLRDPNTGRPTGQVPDEEQATVVRRVFADYNAGVSRRLVADGLNADGVTTQSGGTWDARRVGDILKNPAYYGRRTHNGVDVGEGAWEPLIDAVTFETAAGRRQAATCNKTRATGTARLLSGVARCGVCGGKVRGQKNGAARGGHSYVCIENTRCVQRTGVPLDDFIGGLVAARLSEPDAQQAGRSGEISAVVTEANERIVELESQLDEAADLFVNKDITRKMLAKIEQRIAPKIKAARDEIRSAAVPIDIDVPHEDVAGWWAALAAPTRREIVNALFAVVTINPAGKGQRVFDPAAIAVEWAA